MSNGFKVDSGDYFDGSYFQKELKNILDGYWIFLCPSAILEKENDYFVFSGFGKEVVIRRTLNGGLSAFNNVCQHRGHKLFLDSFGNSEIRCPYHGWLYGDDLKLKKIPWNSKCYHIKENLVELDDDGFVVKDSDGAIWGYFGAADVEMAKYPAEKVADSLSLFSRMSSSTRGVTINDRRFNWKLIFENLYDRVHPTFLHVNSLNKLVDLNFDPFPNDFGVGDVEKTVSANIDNTGFAKGTTEQESVKKIDENMPDGAYLNGHIFPFLHFVTPDGGSTFCYESYIPLSTDKVRVYTFWIAGNKQPIQARLTYVSENIKIASKILKEDWNAVESITSVSDKPAYYTYGAHEKNYYGIKKLGELG